MPFKDLPNSLKPREKANSQGLAALTDIEILALLVRTGTSKTDVLLVARRMLEKYKNFRFMSYLTKQEIMLNSGFGEVKAIELMAIFEVAKRINATTNFTKVAHPDQAIEIAYAYMPTWERENFLLILLDSLNNFIFCDVIYQSTSSEIAVAPRDLLASVLRKNAKKFYCVHNHPSGNANFSYEDKLLTTRIKAYAELMQVEMVGHIVLTEQKEYSIIK